MTPAQLALLADARTLVRALEPLCALLPPEKRAAHLATRCADLAARIDRELPKDGAS